MEACLRHTELSRNVPSFLTLHSVDQGAFIPADTPSIRSYSLSYMMYYNNMSYLEVDLAPSRWGFARIENYSSCKTLRCKISREMFLPYLASFDARFMRDLCEMYEIFMRETTSQARFKCPKKIKVLNYE